MSGEIFNPNPVVFSTKTSGRKIDLTAHSLWLNEAATSEVDADDIDQIDQDEIFGKYSIAFRQVRFG